MPERDGPIGAQGAKAGKARSGLLTVPAALALSLPKTLSLSALHPLLEVKRHERKVVSRRVTLDQRG